MKGAELIWLTQEKMTKTCHECSNENVSNGLRHRDSTHGIDSISVRLRECVSVERDPFAL